MASLRLFTLLAAGQCLATLIGWLAALGSIRAIVVLGPLLSLTGVVIAVHGLLRKHRLGVLYGFAVPALSLLCFCLIFFNRWSPHEAYYPINSLIALFVLAHAPACVLVVRDARRRSFAADEKFNFQFSIRGIMLFTAFVAATLGLQRALGFSGLMLSVLLWHVVVSAWYWWTEPPRPAIPTPDLKFNGLPPQ